MNGTCSLDGHTMAYVREGSGETLLLVHGITTASFIWDPVLPRFARHYDVVAVDLMGCGASDRALDYDYTLRNQAETVERFASALGLGRCHVVAHDVGGGIAQILAVRHAERVADLTLVNTVGYDLWPVQPIAAMRTPILRQLAMATLDLGMLRFIVRRALVHKERATPELLAKVAGQVAAPGARKAFLRFAGALDNADLMAVARGLERLEIPVLIVRGDGDVYLSPEISRRLHRAVPASRLVVLQGAGHYAQVDAPDGLSDVVLSFLREVSGDG